MHKTLSILATHYDLSGAWDFKIEGDSSNAIDAFIFAKYWIWGWRHGRMGYDLDDLQWGTQVTKILETRLGSWTMESWP